jgi:hypothetical protein
MSTQHLSAYLNDHLAGSVAALELVDHLIASKPSTSLGVILDDLRAEIAADQRVLHDLIEALGARESAGRKAVAWLAEKAARLKLRLGGSDAEPLALLEAFEGLSLGIEGKRGLWTALAPIAGSRPALAALDYVQLERRAAEQRERVEALRLAAAERALG